MDIIKLPNLHGRPAGLVDRARHGIGELTINIAFDISPHCTKLRPDTGAALFYTEDSTGAVVIIALCNIEEDWRRETSTHFRIRNLDQNALIKLPGLTHLASCFGIEPATLITLIFDNLPKQK